MLEAKNFEIVRDFLQSHGLLHQARDFLMASGALQTLLYKEEIEVMLRTPGLGGFQLLDLHDFPGQGTALIGVLDPFWEPETVHHRRAVPSLLRTGRAAGALAEPHLDQRSDADRQR